MKKTIFQLIFVYAFSLIAAVLLLISKAGISEDNYLIIQLLLFGYSILTGILCFLPRFIIWLTEIIFKNAIDNPEDYPKGSIYWLIIMTIVLLLGIFFNMTLIIPIAVIIQSVYILFKLIIIYKTLNLTDSEE